MALYRRKMLGLAMEERAVLAAEVWAFARRTELRRAAEFAFPDGVSLEEPQRLGAALGDFLRRHGFSTRNAVVGVPARWLLSKEKHFPPVSPSALAGLVRLGAERSFATDLDHLMIDYANGGAAADGLNVLMTALTRRRADQLLAMADAAGLRARALVSTSMALAAALRPASSSALLLFLRPDHAELVLRLGGRPRAVRHLPGVLPTQAEATAHPAHDWRHAVSDEIQRLVARLPSSDGAAQPEELVIWQGAGLDPDGLRRLGEPLALKTELCDGLAELGLSPSARGEPADEQRCVAAVALARTGARGKGFAVDFLHSRLAARRPTQPARRIVWAAAVVVAVLAALVSLSSDWSRQEEALKELRQRLTVMQPDIDAARRVVQQVTLARGWTDQRPRFLDPLRELTLALPLDQPIWVTSLAMRADRHVAVSGKAADEPTVLDTLDRIRNNPAFTGVKLLYLRDAGGSSRELAFSMTFNFVNEE